MWHAPVITPADAGPLPTGNPEEALIRKPRPSPQLEVMLKTVETTVIDEEINKLQAYFGPRQMGVAAPDGPTAVIKVLRGRHIGTDKMRTEPDAPQT